MGRRMLGASAPSWVGSGGWYSADNRRGRRQARAKEKRKQCVEADAERDAESGSDNSR